jgi:hypothetical protein
MLIGWGCFRWHWTWSDLVVGSTPATIDGPLSPADYAVRHGKLCPEVAIALKPFFPDMPMCEVRVSIKDEDWVGFAATGTGKGIRDWLKSVFLGKGYKTPAFVSGRTIYCTRAWLNGEARQQLIPNTSPRQYRVFNYADLATARGWGVLAHEVKHVEQYVQKGFVRWLGTLAGSVWSSWWNAGLLWSHGDIEFEREAIALEGRVRQRFDGYGPRWFDWWRRMR